ncbi:MULTISPECIES: hypothetical protein [unclassified Streptomyces]|uniref:hypothetical protein n=1 Tax=unclassified Streptomyces TaxID=2593676 RepID=UPI0004C9ADB1|nr:hypothetical protein [Streptomyces sp. NRRL F-2747]
MNVQSTRAAPTVEGRTLSYLDFGGTGRPLIALHGHRSDGSVDAAAEQDAPGAEHLHEFTTLPPNQRARAGDR